VIDGWGWAIGLISAGKIWLNFAHSTMPSLSICWAFSIAIEALIDFCAPLAYIEAANVAATDI
jgi:hypothetical protein